MTERRRRFSGEGETAGERGRRPGLTQTTHWHRMTPHGADPNPVT